VELNYNHRLVGFSLKEECSVVQMELKKKIRKRKMKQKISSFLLFSLQMN